MRIRTMTREVSIVVFLVLSEHEGMEGTLFPGPLYLRLCYTVVVIMCFSIGRVGCVGVSLRKSEVGGGENFGASFVSLGYPLACAYFR